VLGGGAIGGPGGYGEKWIGERDGERKRDGDGKINVLLLVC
jgi:hypothetical protein